MVTERPPRTISSAPIRDTLPGAFADARRGAPRPPPCVIASPTRARVAGPAVVHRDDHHPRRVALRRAVPLPPAPRGRRAAPSHREGRAGQARRRSRILPATRFGDVYGKRRGSAARAPRSRMRAAKRAFVSIVERAQPDDDAGAAKRPGAPGGLRRRRGPGARVRPCEQADPRGRRARARGLPGRGRSGRAPPRKRTREEENGRAGPACPRGRWLRWRLRRRPTA